MWSMVCWAPPAAGSGPVTTRSSSRDSTSWIAERPPLLPAPSRPCIAWFQSPPHRSSSSSEMAWQTDAVRSAWVPPCHGADPPLLRHGSTVAQTRSPRISATAEAGWGEDIGTRSRAATAAYRTPSRIEASDTCTCLPGGSRSSGTSVSSRTSHASASRKVRCRSPPRPARFQVPSRSEGASTVIPLSRSPAAAIPRRHRYGVRRRGRPRRRARRWRGTCRRIAAPGPGHAPRPR